MYKCRTDLYDGGLVQQNMLYHLSSEKRKKIRNTPYSKDIIEWNSNLRKENEGNVIKDKISTSVRNFKSSTMTQIDAVHLTSKGVGITYLFPTSVENKSTISGFELFDLINNTS